MDLSPGISGDDMLYFYESENSYEAQDYISSETMQEAAMHSTTVSSSSLSSSSSNQESIISPGPKIPLKKSSKPSKRHKYLKILPKFKCISKSRNTENNASRVKRPKKEYFRTKGIRGHKRGIRQSLSDKFPHTTINKIDINNEIQMAAWAAFKRYNQEHRQFFISFSRTESGPLTDGKSKRLLYSSKDSPDEKTCNDAFVRWYFSFPFVVESFKLYVLYLFAGKTDNELCERFGISCCTERMHNEECQKNWEELKNQLLNEFITIHVREAQL